VSKYYISIGRYGADFVYDVVSDEAFLFWSKEGPEAIQNYVFDNGFEERDADVAPPLRLPRWHGDDGQRYSGCFWSSDLQIEVRSLEGEKEWSVGFDDLNDDPVRSNAEIYPDREEHAILACVPYKGSLYAGEFETGGPFDPTLLKFDIVDVLGTEIVTRVYYDGKEIYDTGGEGRPKSDGEVRLI